MKLTKEELEARIETLNDLVNEVAQTDIERSDELFSLVEILDELVAKKEEEPILLRLFREFEYVSGQEIYGTETWASTRGILKNHEKLKKIIWEMSLNFIHDFDDDLDEEEWESCYKRRVKALDLKLRKPNNKSWSEFYSGKAETASLNNLLASLLLTNDGRETGYISIDWAEIIPDQKPEWQCISGFCK